MLFIILAIIGTIIEYIFLRKKYTEKTFFYKKEENQKEQVLAALSTGAIILCFGILTAMICGFTAEYNNNLVYKHKNTQEINQICLTPSSSIEGKKQKVYIYEYNDELGTTKGEIPVEKSYIHKNSKSNKIITYKSKCKNNFIGFWLGGNMVLTNVHHIYIT